MVTTGRRDFASCSAVPSSSLAITYDHTFVRLQLCKSRCTFSHSFAHMRLPIITYLRSSLCQGICDIDNITWRVFTVSLAIRDRKSKRLTPVTNAHLVCRLLLEKKQTN